MNDSCGAWHSIAGFKNSHAFEKEEGVGNQVHLDVSLLHHAQQQHCHWDVSTLAYIGMSAEAQGQAVVAAAPVAAFLGGLRHTMSVACLVASHLLKLCLELCCSRSCVFQVWLPTC